MVRKGYKYYQKIEKKFQTEAARIKQTLEEFLDKDTPLLERIRTLISENIVLIISRPTAFLIGIATIVLSAISNFG